MSFIRTGLRELGLKVRVEAQRQQNAKEQTEAIPHSSPAMSVIGVGSAFMPCWCTGNVYGKCAARPAIAAR